MKKRFSTCMFAVMLALSLTMPAYANSSWVWFSESRPYTILPFVIAVTLLIEISAVKLICKTDSLKKTVIVVTPANLISFAVPYLWELFWLDKGFDLSYILEHTPFYTIGAVFLLVTILCELPVVYVLLRKNTEKKGRLLFTVIGANVITTALAAAAEGILCRGEYL